MSATANPGSARAPSAFPPAAFFPRWRVTRELTPASDAALVADAVAHHVSRRPPTRDLPEQGASPDADIRLDQQCTPVQRSNPDELLGQAVDAATWTTTHRSFPGGAEWEVNALNAQAWAGHQFAGHFSERVLRQIVNPEGHPLFELRLDLLAYEVLFARFVGVPHRPGSQRWELPAAMWSWATTLRPEDLPEEWSVKLRPQAWTPDLETQNGRDLLRCLQASCRDYAEGLALYLLPGREHWGGG